MELDPEWFCFSTIAMFQKHKGLPFLLNTFRGVIDRTPKMAVNGRLRTLEGELRAQVDRLGMASPSLSRFPGGCAAWACGCKLLCAGQRV